jgi:hypothetical protein
MTNNVSSVASVLSSALVSGEHADYPVSVTSADLMFAAEAEAQRAYDANTEVTRTFDVLNTRVAGVEEALTKLNKRAARKGLPLLSWSWGKAFAEVVWMPANQAFRSGVEILDRSSQGESVKVRAVRVPLTIVGATPKYQGWTFVAALQHLDGENIIRSVEGAEIPAKYRTSGPACDHCKVSRRRNDTYVLRHVDGDHVQVGSTCIGDFLGSDKAGKIADTATLLADACAIAGDDEEGFGSCGPRPYLASEFLAYVAWEVEALGWVSRTAARDHGGMATADHAWELMTDGRERSKCNAKPTAEHAALADAALAWAEGLTDAEVDAAKSDYLHNLRAASRTGLVTHRTAGIIGSTVIAYQNYLGKERARKERAAMPKADIHVGTIKQRLTTTARLEFVTGYETQYGYTTVLKFRTLDGALLVWKASSTDVGRDDAGKLYNVTGTVVKHDIFRGEYQTLVNRCKLAEVKEAQAA